MKLHHRSPGSAFYCHLQHNWLWLSLLSEQGCLVRLLTVPKYIVFAVPRGHQPLEHRQDCWDVVWGLVLPDLEWELELLVNTTVQSFTVTC